MKSLFRVGSVVKLNGGEVLIESFDGRDEQGREVYTVITASVRMVGEHPVNRFKAVVVPTLTITGVAA